LIVSRYEKPFFTFRKLNIHSGEIGQGGDKTTTLSEAQSIGSILISDEFDFIFSGVYEGGHPECLFCEVVLKNVFRIADPYTAFLSVFGEGVKDPDYTIRSQGTRLIKMIEEEKLEDGKIYILFSRGVSCGRTIWVKALQVQNTALQDKKWLLDASYKPMSFDDSTVFILPQPKVPS
jgi:hypothetical protein